MALNESDRAALDEITELVRQAEAHAQYASEVLDGEIRWDTEADGSRWPCCSAEAATAQALLQLAAMKLVLITTEAMIDADG